MFLERELEHLSYKFAKHLKDLDLQRVAHLEVKGQKLSDEEKVALEGVFWAKDAFDRTINRSSSDLGV